MSHRPQQVAREILKVLSFVIHEELPIEQFGLITITEVDVSPNLESAKVYFSVLNSTDDIEANLNRKSKWLGRLLQNKILLRKIPTLHFVLDESAERFNRIDDLIRKEEEKLKQ